MKVLVAVLACHKYVSMLGRGWDWTNRMKHNSIPVNAQIAACRETWVKDLAAYPNVDVRFFYGRGANRQPLPDEVFLDVPDDYKGLPYKTRGMCHWSGSFGYDFTFKTDDDTFVWADRLMKSGFENYDYLGAVSYLGKFPYATGLGYWISLKCARLIAAGHPNNTLEDHWVGEVLHKNHIAHKYDDRYRSLGGKFVGVNAMPRNHDYIAMHPCSPEMLRACWSEAHQ
jgi:hypothetical protein